uniref:Uncharacterized protein n=1 Tax=Octopus bimaculoides TaxID=37653 RepID=A0A0L8FYE7_OCTBM
MTKRLPKNPVAPIMKNMRLVAIIPPKLTIPLSAGSLSRGPSSGRALLFATDRKKGFTRESFSSLKVLFRDDDEDADADADNENNNDDDGDDDDDDNDNEYEDEGEDEDECDNNGVRGFRFIFTKSYDRRNINKQLVPVFMIWLLLLFVIVVMKMLNVLSSFCSCCCCIFIC